MRALFPPASRIGEREFDFIESQTEIAARFTSSTSNHLLSFANAVI